MTRSSVVVPLPHHPGCSEDSVRVELASAPPSGPRRPALGRPLASVYGAMRGAAPTRAGHSWRNPRGAAPSDGRSRDPSRPYTYRGESVPPFEPLVDGGRRVPPSVPREEEPRALSESSGRFARRMHGRRAVGSDRRGPLRQSRPWLGFSCPDSRLWRLRVCV